MNFSAAPDNYFHYRLIRRLFFLLNQLIVWSIKFQAKVLHFCLENNLINRLIIVALMNFMSKVEKM